MPKNIIDYSNTIIYKIYCLDENVTDLYVGHTTNFFKRKHQHKCSSMNEKYSKTKLYKTIKENGNWDNWNMVIIATYDCKNSTEARIKEQYHTEQLGATLNSLKAFITDEERKMYYKKGSEWYDNNQARAKKRYTDMCSTIAELKMENAQLKEQLNKILIKS